MKTHILIKSDQGILVYSNIVESYRVPHVLEAVIETLDLRASWVVTLNPSGR